MVNDEWGRGSALQQRQVSLIPPWGRGGGGCTPLIAKRQEPFISLSLTGGGRHSRWGAPLGAGAAAATRQEGEGIGGGGGG